MSYVELDRRFSRWHGETARDDDFRLFEQHFFGEASWAELLKHQRVVILAAAGSGKSQELEERAKRLQAEGEFAFHASVRNIGNEGLEGAFDAAGKKRLEDWRASEATAWFFIDSVDEAKLDHVRFVDALRKLGDGLGYGLSRARIILSGRYSHWEFRADLESLESVLPIAKHAEAMEADTILSKILRNEFRRESKKAAPEKPLVVLMAPLDIERVRKFAEGQGVQDLDAFMSALEAENLWDLAKRPLDLSWLVDYWQKNLRFGRFAEMLEVSIRYRLIEPNPEHGKCDQIDAERAFAALERLGATMVFGRSVRIEIPDTKLAVGTSPAIKLQDVLSDWPPGDLPQLLTRPVFEICGKVGDGV